MDIDQRLNVVVLSVHGNQGRSATTDLVKSGVVYGDRVQLFDPGVSLLATLGNGGIDLTDFAADSSSDSKRSLAQLLVALEDLDIDSLTGLADLDLVDLVEPIRRDEIGQGRSIELFLARFANLVNDPDGFVMLDPASGRVFQHLAARGDFVVDPLAARRSREATTANGLLGRLPNFRLASLDDVLGVREELAGSLPRFRAGVHELSQTFDGEPGSSLLFGEIDEAWRATVAPALQEIIELTADSRFLRSLVDTAFRSGTTLTGGGIGVATAAAAGLGEVGLSLATLAGSALGMSASALRDSMEARRETARQRFFLLYQVDQLLSE